MTEPNPSPLPSRKSFGRRLLWPALFFASGLGAAGWFLLGTQTGSSLITGDAQPQPEANAGPAGAAITEESTAVLQRRLTEMETRLAQAQAGQEVSGPPATDRSTGLVLTFAARRAIERGQPLGPIEGELSRYFGVSKPHLVAAVAAFARKPVPLEKIKSDFEAIAPNLSGAGDGLWAKITGDLGNLFTVRPRDKPATDRQVIISQARTALDSGNVSEALTLITKLPDRAEAAEWMASARRYSDANKALDELESLAFAGPASAAPLPPTLPVPPTILPDAIENAPAAPQPTPSPPAK